MLHHVSFSVTELARSAGFYAAALGALGFRRVFEADTAIGYGLEDGKDKFLLNVSDGPACPPSPGFHLAFAAQNRDQVDAFHAEGVRHGGVDNGAPGLRPHYGPHYYAAFVFDPDGHAIEAVINTPRPTLPEARAVLSDIGEFFDRNSS